MTFRTREEWLMGAIDALREVVFAEHEIKVPQVRVSVGFPGGRAKKATTVGQCWNSSSTEDGRPAVFVHPTVGDRLEVLSILVHELIHAIDDCQSGHRGDFAKMFRLVGMVGKTTQSAVSDELRAKLQTIAKGLGVYPHSAMKREKTNGLGEKKQKTRMLKVVCLNEECGVKIRMANSWIEDPGVPTCACGSGMEAV